VFDTADSPDDEFIFGLGRILDGVGVLIGELRLSGIHDREGFGTASRALSHISGWSRGVSWSGGCACGGGGRMRVRTSGV
jgi:hypothetical protein